METRIRTINKINNTDNVIFPISDIKNIPVDILNKYELNFVKIQRKEKKDLITINQFTRWIFIWFIKDEKDEDIRIEKCRKTGDSLLSVINENKLKSVCLYDIEGNSDEVYAFAEGMMLGSYQFLKYKTDKTKEKNSLVSIKVLSEGINKKVLDELMIIAETNHKCRTFVDEPVVYLNAETFAKDIQKMAMDSGVKIDILKKKKIETLKMGGLLAVNQGSTDPPTFTILEWKPEKAKNSKPYVFVGKGVLYDTGGINLKPGSGLLEMKSDMAGAAVVASSICAIAKSKLPVHVIGLIPATDNRLNSKAYVPGDIITMYDGTNVEVLNTDAEGRLILADALSYAKKYNPQLVINIATLTGSAADAIGKYGMVGMFAKSENEFRKLQQSGKQVHERIVEFPFWEEYRELLKSDIADIKNIGPREGGAITAGKFLEHFTDYPFIHLDIAGCSYMDKKDSYRGIGGSGIGVRLLYDFVKTKV